MKKVSIVGATGYVGIELMRLLHEHPEVEIKDLVSKSSSGRMLVDIYPQFRGSKLAEKKLIPLTDFEVEASDLVFTALPHGVSQNIVGELYGKGTKIIDLSGDFRYHDLDIYEKWYGVEHKFPELAAEAAYGLVELNRQQIKKADLVANPGCYVTASLLGLLPLIDFKKINPASIIVDAKSGVSGAGRSLKENLLFTETHNSMKAYSPGTHRHGSEIEYILSQYLEGAYSGDNSAESEAEAKALKTKAEVLFTPHLIPIKRGILATIYLELKEESSQAEIRELYRKQYEDEYFIQLLAEELPEIKNVAGSNFAQIGFRYDERTKRLIIVSAIDNMLKGAAGQAVQNMNLVFDLPESTGLEATALFP
ncbi:N-acetyl-gamma-glutamyl-phosphate reductase [Halanaerobium saccharolyticum]|uniref:N-acetyl-gamma-glutamyl-phosphate reductase n=1 Tax=Halanaerobium saccharolyticum TaxID=43595 RepID=A0A2T5RHK5_9FIRM|nr:N-acetyl-gamma-glutamyl-phosphate reductase [Halanaerobium saccharolyticum]PTV96173.1 N-acetyl-gamma-glutamyl-phosphate reductase [Halanaerobium saccharolyticum]